MYKLRTTEEKIIQSARSLHTLTWAAAPDERAYQIMAATDLHRVPTREEADLFAKTWAEEHAAWVALRQERGLDVFNDRGGAQ